MWKSAWTWHRSALLTSLGTIGVALAGLVWAFTMYANPGGAHDSESIAEKFGVTIVWQTRVFCAGPDDRVAGCFLPATPDTIYVRVDQVSDLEHYIVLHEIAHVIQYRLGQDRDECGADRIAQSLGASYGNYCEPIN